MEIFSIKISFSLGEANKFLSKIKIFDISYIYYNTIEFLQVRCKNFNHFNPQVKK